VALDTDLRNADRQARKMAAERLEAPEPWTGRALWPTFMRRTLAAEDVAPRAPRRDPIAEAQDAIGRA